MHAVICSMVDSSSTKYIYVFFSQNLTPFFTEQSVFPVASEGVSHGAEELHQEFNYTYD